MKLTKGGKMNLPKAIEIMEYNIEEVGKQMPPDVLKAAKLLTEAGKEVLKSRIGDPALDGELLPGETEE